MAARALAIVPRKPHDQAMPRSPTGPDGPPPEAPREDAVRAIWQRGAPLRRLRARRRRFASACFLISGIAFGTSVYLLRTRVHRMFEPRVFPVFVALIGVMVGLFILGASAEGEVTRLEEQLAALEEEMGRALRRRT